MAAEDGEPPAVELVQPFEQLRECVDVGPVANDGAQDFACEPEEKRGA